MYRSGVKPLKGGGTRWINYKLQAMGRFYVFGLKFCCPRNPAGKTEKTGGRQSSFLLTDFSSLFHRRFS